MVSRYEKFAESPATKRQLEECSLIFNKEVTLEDLLRLIFDVRHEKNFPYSTSLKDILEDETILSRGLKDILKRNRNLTNIETALIYSYNHKNFYLKSFESNINNDEIYNFHKQLPYTLFNVTNNLNFHDKGPLYTLYKEFVTELLIKGGENHPDLINYFSNFDTYFLVLALFHKTTENYSLRKNMSNILQYYFLNNIEEYYKFMRYFNDFNGFREFLVYYTDAITNNIIDPNFGINIFNMGKFCELSDPASPMEWNLELHFIESMELLQYSNSKVI